MLLGKPGTCIGGAFLVAMTAVLEFSSAVAIAVPPTDLAQMAPLQHPTPTMPKHTDRSVPVHEVEMKPDLRATTFSPQNAYFFALLSKISYKDRNEAEGLLVGNSTIKGLGFDRFHWFEVGEGASKRYFDDTHETEAFVAASDDMIAVVFRGTTGGSDWMTNLKFSWRNCPAEWNLPKPGGDIHEGFDDGVSSVWLPAGMHSTIKSLYYEKGKNRKLYLGGHSLGGALATIAASRLAFVDDMDVAGVYTVGCPRIFSQDSAKHFDAKINHGVALKDKTFRCRNNNDIVARVPPFPYEHVGTEIYLDRFGAVSDPDLMDRLLGRLDSYRQGEFIDGANDHALAEYLRLLGLLASNSGVSPL